MSKRRNKNKKAGPVKLIRPEQPAAPAAEDTRAEVPASEPEASDQADLLASAIQSEAVSVEAESDSSQQETDLGDAQAAEALAIAEALAEEVAPAASWEDAVADVEATPAEASGSEGQAHESSPQVPEFEDASAALARAIQVDPVEVADTTQLPSIPILDASAISFDAVESAAPGWDSAPQDASADSAVQAPDEQAAGHAGGGGRNKKDRKLKLNKLQKHARGAPEPEPEPEAFVPEPEPAPVPRAPREPRIAAFAKLAEYQTLSLAHVPGQPEESDVPGHWRGVGFGIGGRRLVSAFDEVVEIMRLPQITHVPGTQPWMLGVANVRGTLLPVVDLKQFLEGERTVMHEGQRVLVVRQAGGNVAVLIDQLFGQRSFNDAQKTDLTAQGDNRYGHFIKQIYRVGDNDWGVFSMSMLTRTPEFRQAAA